MRQCGGGGARNLAGTLPTACAIDGHGLEKIGTWAVFIWIQGVQHYLCRAIRLNRHTARTAALGGYLPCMIPSNERPLVCCGWRAVGRTIEEICGDLAVVPGLCTSAFWNGIFEIMLNFGGKVETVMREKTRREQAFIKEQDRKLDSSWDWLHLKPDEIRERLGFFIGEPPVDPFDVALATGPP
jgi:hypothetical protein